jgi:hypothetical protein
MYKVRYTGVVPTLFNGRVGYHEPDDVFGLSDGEAEGYIHRPDIEVLEAPEAAPEEVAGKPAVDAEPVAAEEPEPAAEPAEEPVPETPAQ